MAGLEPFDRDEVSRLFWDDKKKPDEQKTLSELVEIAKTGVWADGYKDDRLIGPTRGLSWLPNSSNALYAISYRISEKNLSEKDKKLLPNLADLVVKRICEYWEPDGGRLSEPASKIFNSMIEGNFEKPKDILTKLIKTPGTQGKGWGTVARLNTLDLVLENHFNELTFDNIKDILDLKPNFFVKDDRLKKWFSTERITPEFVAAVLDCAKNSDAALNLFGAVLKAEKKTATPEAAEKLLDILDGNVAASKDPVEKARTSRLILERLSDMMENEDIAKMNGLSDRISGCARLDNRACIENYIATLEKTRDKDLNEVMGNFAESLLKDAGNLEKGSDLRDQQRKDEARKNALVKHKEVWAKHPEIITPDSCVDLVDIAINNKAVEYPAFANLKSALSSDEDLNRLTTRTLYDKLCKVNTTNETVFGMAAKLRFRIDRIGIVSDTNLSNEGISPK